MEEDTWRSGYPCFIQALKQPLFSVSHHVPASIGTCSLHLLSILGVFVGHTG